MSNTPKHASRCGFSAVRAANALAASGLSLRLEVQKTREAEQQKTGILTVLEEPPRAHERVPITMENQRSESQYVRQSRSHATSIAASCIPTQSDAANLATTRRPA